MAERTERWVLNHLIETCRDGARGFRHAASHVGSVDLKALFEEIAAQRTQFAAELLPHAQRLGGANDTDGTIQGALHRGWMSMRDALEGSHDDGILAEAVRGEHAAVAAYKDALNGMLPPTTRDVIEQQSAQVRTSHDRIRARLKA
jgi:uncharacterized protein (TIGR02284 family)